MFTIAMGRIENLYFNVNRLSGQYQVQASPPPTTQHKKYEIQT